jgi:hypothetical protein
MTNPIPNPQPLTPNPRSRANSANALLSTGPRTAAGKQRSSLNALRHGLTAASAVLASEDPAAYEDHRRRFFEEYQPDNPTETQLTQELADTSWRLNRIPVLEAALLDRDLDIVDAHLALATLGLHYQRLSRQFQKAVDNLREIQSERRRQQQRQLNSAAALLELHKRKGIPYHPAAVLAENGFVFSKDEVEAFAERQMRLNESLRFEYPLFHIQPPIGVVRR